MTYRPLKPIFDSIYLFHMPAFLFISGLFSKKSSLTPRKILRLILILLAFNTILMIGAGGLSPSNWKWMSIHLSAWYLFALILYRLSIPILEKMGITTSLLLFTTLGILQGLLKQTDPFCLYKIIPLFPFFIAGYWCGKLKYLQKNKEINTNYNLKSLGCVLFCIIITCGLYALKLHIITERTLLWFPYITPNDIIDRLILYLLGVLSILALLLITPNRNIPCLTTWGFNSLIIYVIHRPITQLLHRLLPFFQENIQGVLIFVSISVTLLFCNTPYFVHLFNRIFDFLTDSILQNKK